MNSLIILSNTINNTSSIIDDIVSISKKEFASNEPLINMATGFISEINEIISTIDDEIYILNDSLYKIILPIKKFSRNLFNNYKIVNAYKLYDFFLIDLKNLQAFLNSLGD